MQLIRQYINLSSLIMTIAITAATSLELDKVSAVINANQPRSIQLLQQVTGVGMLQSTFGIAQLINNAKPDLVIQVGLGRKL